MSMYLEAMPVSSTLSRYDHLTREQLIALLEKQRREKKLGLVWERDALEPDSGVNEDFVALTLVPELSAGLSPYQNLLVEGDNYDVLRYLHIAYRGRVKVIYIDPPYNTGNRDFIYNDRFVDEEHRYRHSLWLEFMARRLELARDLLAEDGVILVSISEHEHARLVMLMDEVFPGMRVGSFVWRTRSGANDEKTRFLSIDHEYVVAYGNPEFVFSGNRKAFTGYGNPDGDARGDWLSGPLIQGKSWKQRPGHCPFFEPLPVRRALRDRRRLPGLDVYPGRQACVVRHLGGRGTRFVRRNRHPPASQLRSCLRRLRRNLHRHGLGLGLVRRRCPPRPLRPVRCRPRSRRGTGHHVRAKSMTRCNSRRIHMSQLRAQPHVAGGSFAQGVTPALASPIFDHDH